MNIKRDMGVCRIFLLSCGTAAALAALLWLAASIVCAVTVADAAGDRAKIYRESVSDINTPWLMLAAGMFTYHRFWGMCSANSVSPKKQALCLAGISPIFSALFACADIAFVKGILQRIYGNPVCLSLESWGSYFYEQYYIKIYKGTIEAANAVFPARMMFLLFAVTAMYYCTFFLSGCFIMACIDSGRTKRSVYYLVTAPLGTFLFFPLALPLIYAPFDSEPSLAFFYVIAFAAACLTGFFPLLRCFLTGSPKQCLLRSPFGI